MEILTNYNNDTLQLISDGPSYSLSDFDSDIHIIKLSVFRSNGVFLRGGELTKDIGFYISQDQLFLKPNQFLDREGFSEGNYNLQFDFISRFTEEDLFYISEISPSRKEIRLSIPTLSISTASRDDTIIPFMNGSGDSYQFNSNLELSQGRLIPINGYAFDEVTSNKRTLVIKLNEPLPSFSI